MFQDILTSLLARVDGAEWAFVAGLDGLVVDVAPPVLPPGGELLAAEYASLLRTTQRTTTATGAGDLAGSLLVTDRSKVVLEILTPEYFLAMSLTSAGHSGRARFEIGRARDLLERELVF